MKKQANTTKIIKLTDYDGLKKDISQTIYNSLNKDLYFNQNKNYNIFENTLTGAIN